LNVAFVASHAIRGRAQEAAWRCDKFMRLHSGLSEEPHQVV
jgi:hypothetical protein